MSGRPRREWRGAPLIALASFAFAAMAVLTRALADAVPPGQLVFVRFLIGLVGVVALFAWRRERPKTGRPWTLLGRGVFGGIAVLLYFVALHELEVGPATLLNYSSSIFAALFATLFLGERVGPRLGVGLLLATTGAIAVGYGTTPPDKPLAFGMGVYAGAASALFSGAAMTSIRALRPTTSALTILLAFCGAGAALALPFALHDWRTLDARTWGLVLGVGLLSLVGQLVFTYAFAFVSAIGGSAVSQLTPAISWVMGVALLGEHPTLLAVSGALLCTCGVLLGSLPGWRPSLRQPGPGDPPGAG